MAGGIGRITGPLLKDNLVRNGVDLSFETDLLYLDVNTNKIGIKTDSPGKELFIEQYAKTIDLIVDDYITANKIEIDTSSNIFTSLDKLYLDSQQSITAPGLKTDKLLIEIVSLFSNSFIIFVPNCTPIKNSSFSLSSSNKICPLCSGIELEGGIKNS
jgi:hypothetical protein